MTLMKIREDITAIEQWSSLNRLSTKPRPYS